MISFRTRDDSIASSISIIAVLMLAGTLAWMLLVPDPTEAGIARGRTRTERQLQSEIDSAKATNDQTQQLIAPLVWVGNQETVGPEALGTVMQFAKARNLKLVAFRPQRPIPQGDVTVVPYGISIQGTFLNAMQFVKDLETPSSKLAVEQVQISASDATSDNVNGTINAVAYLVPAAIGTSATTTIATTTKTVPGKVAVAPKPIKPTVPAGGKSAQRTK